jgi:hypothetical protein
LNSIIPAFSFVFDVCVRKGVWESGWRNEPAREDLWWALDWFDGTVVQ